MTAAPWSFLPTGNARCKFNYAQGKTFDPCGWKGATKARDLLAAGNRARHVR